MKHTNTEVLAMRTRLRQAYEVLSVHVFARVRATLAPLGVVVSFGRVAPRKFFDLHLPGLVTGTKTEVLMGRIQRKSLRALFLH